MCRRLSWSIWLDPQSPRRHLCFTRKRALSQPSGRWRGDPEQLSEASDGRSGWSQAGTKHHMAQGSDLLQMTGPQRTSTPCGKTLFQRRKSGLKPTPQPTKGIAYTARRERGREREGERERKYLSTLCKKSDK